MGGGGICDELWKPGRSSVGGGGMVRICASERAKPTSDYADVFESAE